MEKSSTSGFQRIRTRRAFEEICDQIRGRITKGDLKPGDKLPAERDMAATFEVSRLAVREALRALENAGVVHLTKGAKGGAFIQDAHPAMLTNSLEEIMRMGGISLNEITEARLVINEQVLRLACQRRTRSDLTALEGVLELLDSSTDLSDRAEAGARFFTLLARATGNRALVMLVDAMTEIVRHGMDGASPRSRPELQPVRRRLVVAVRARSFAAARRAMEDYLKLVHGAVLLAATLAQPEHAQ